MEYLKGKKDIVFVGLNPTEEAKKNNAVFSERNTFWKILKEAGLIDKYPEDLTKCADAVFGVEKNLGYADLVPGCTAKKSSNVKIPANAVSTLLEKIEKTEAKKVVLLGHKVAEAFVKELGLSKEWEELKKHKDYGYLGKGKYPKTGSEFDVYVMPFPETAPVPEKSKFYKKIIQ